MINSRTPRRCRTFHAVDLPAVKIISKAPKRFLTYARPRSIVMTLFTDAVIMFSSPAADNRDLAGEIFHVAPRASPSPPPPPTEPQGGS